MPFDSISSVWRHFRAPGGRCVFTGARGGRDGDRLGVFEFGEGWGWEGGGDGGSLI